MIVALRRLLGAVLIAAGIISFGAPTPAAAADVQQMHYDDIVEHGLGTVLAQLLEVLDA